MPDYELSVSFNVKVQSVTKLGETELVGLIKEILEVQASRLGVTLSNIKAEVASASGEMISAITMPL